MKKIIIAFGAISLFACSKQAEQEVIEKRVEKKVEKIVEIDPKVRKEVIISSYLEELEPITPAKAQTDALVTIDEYNGEIFVGVETTNGSNKTYSLQKLDPKTGSLSVLIPNLFEIKDVLLSEKYIFVTQNNTVKVFDRQTYELQVIVGSGTHGGQTGMNKVLALALTQDYLLVRDEKMLRFYRLSDIVQANTQNISVVAKSGSYTRDYGSLSVIDKKVYFSSLFSREFFHIYNLNDNFLITDNQPFDADISRSDTKVYQLLNFRDELYVSLAQEGLATIDKQNGRVLKKYKTYKQQDVNIERFVIVQNKLYALDKQSAKVLVYDIKDVVYKEY